MWVWVSYIPVKIKTRRPNTNYNYTQTQVCAHMQTHKRATHPNTLKCNRPYNLRYEGSIFPFSTLKTKSLSLYLGSPGKTNWNIIVVWVSSSCRKDWNVVATVNTLAHIDHSAHRHTHISIARWYCFYFLSVLFSETVFIQLLWNPVKRLTHRSVCQPCVRE